MNGEAEFAYRLRRALNRGAESLAPETANRLFAARQKALAHQRVAAGGLALAGVGNLVTESFSSHFRTMLAALALVAGVTFAYCWNMYDQAVEHAEIDSALLADEVPFNAYLDQGFLEWLNRRAQEAPEDSSPQ